MNNHEIGPSIETMRQTFKTEVPIIIGELDQLIPYFTDNKQVHTELLALKNDLVRSLGDIEDTTVFDEPLAFLDTARNAIEELRDDMVEIVEREAV